MAFKEKTPVGFPPSTDIELEDEMPKLPDEIVRKFSELAEYNRQVDEFWDSVKNSLIFLGERVTVQENLINKQETLITELTTRVTALETFHP
jgi:hypothetical protein|tara:strand:- start:477 stop:752 length:276 start_codon:yes stop_codon:yes gene_type:complete